MKRALVISFLMILAGTACGTGGPDEAAPGTSPTSGAAVPPSEAVASSRQELVGANACTPEKQYACDSCIAGCDGICAQPGGGGRAGGCIGLFCPTRCDACRLGCFKACGKCSPTF